MFIFFRTLTYASLFIGLLFIYFPFRILASPGIAPNGASGWNQIAGFAIGSLGALTAVACIAAFVTIGKGTLRPSILRGASSYEDPIVLFEIRCTWAPGSSLRAQRSSMDLSGFWPMVRSFLPQPIASWCSMRSRYSRVVLDLITPPTA